MLEIIYHDQVTTADFVRSLLERDVDSFGECSAIGIAYKQKLIAGVVFNNYFGRDIQASIAATAPHWASRRTLAAIFNYPFRQLGCARITAQTRHDNLAANCMLQRLGFRPEGRLRAWYEDGDAEIYGMLSSECRWLP